MTVIVTLELFYYVCAFVTFYDPDDSIDGVVCVVTEFCASRQLA